SGGANFFAAQCSAMRIVIAGGSGFIGGPLVQRLAARGDEVAVITRNPTKVSAVRALSWEQVAEAAKADVVINLAGENVGGGRWTAERKRRILESRLRATRSLVETLQAAPDINRTFINASAIGYYGLRGDEAIDESASSGDGFLAQVTREWETVAHRA